jgi:hypothetical protein
MGSVQRGRGALEKAFRTEKERGRRESCAPQTQECARARGHVIGPRRMPCSTTLSKVPGTSSPTLARRTRERTPRRPLLLRAIRRCRTAALGGHIDQCSQCGHQAISYNSCRNRCRDHARGRGRARTAVQRPALGSGRYTKLPLGVGTHFLARRNCWHRALCRRTGYWLGAFTFCYTSIRRDGYD